MSQTIHLLDSPESRRHLSATLVDRVLTVEGSRFYDDIVIRRKTGDPSILVISHKRRHGVPVISEFDVAEVLLVRVNLNEGNDRFLVDDTAAIVLTHREINGGGGDDLISGGRTADVINAGAGNDIISGRQGHDIIGGGGGDDLIDGGGGNDTVYAGEGEDSIFAGSGDDQLFGDEGNDVLDGSFGSDEVHGGDGDDILTGNFNIDGPEFPLPVLTPGVVTTPRPGITFFVDTIFGDAGNDDFDAYDEAQEFRDRSLTQDFGGNTLAPKSQRINGFLNSRAFE